MPYHSSTPCAYSRACEERRYAEYESAVRDLREAFRLFATRMRAVSLLADLEPGSLIPQTPEEMIQGFAEYAEEAAEFCVDCEALRELREVVSLNREAA
jgi:hypothetical protein